MSTVISKPNNESKAAIRYLGELAQKHSVNPDHLMTGMVQGDIYVWEWDGGRSQSQQFRTLEIIQF